MVDPRVLPCTHTACKGCLIGQLDAQKVVCCKNCNNVFDVRIENLPVYTPGQPMHGCDVCSKKGKKVQPATMYCSTCSKKYCKSHQESHNDVHDDHVTLSISEYVEKAEQMETRACEKHPTQAYSLGCRSCLDVFCLSCASPQNTCKEGKPHELQNLESLLANLSADINSLKEEVIKRENKLTEISKKAFKEISKFEKETEEMVKQLHKTRDEQINAIQVKYMELEDELISSRIATQEKMTEFMEEEVGTMLANLSIQRTEIEGRVRNNHKVDIVKAFREMQAKLGDLKKRQLPQFRVMDVQSIEMAG
ncbi:E3 ubiquitin-protein ligase TRIM56-like [Watersipora subatra]|uniref:E3 ubiquitin-protein ligase TRIM56-like n=1 Tax=Watersipora subatra TaxID=2589382 RepID=UPI00355C5B7F